MREKRAYENTLIQTESSTSTTLVGLNTLDYKKARQNRRQSVVIQSALCGCGCGCKDLTNKCSAFVACKKVVSR